MTSWRAACALLVPTSWWLSARRSGRASLPISADDLRREIQQPGAKFMTVDDFVVFTRLSKMTVYRLIHDEELGAIRMGRNFRIPMYSAVEFLKEPSSWSWSGTGPAAASPGPTMTPRSALRREADEKAACPTTSPDPCKKRRTVTIATSGSERTGRVCSVPSLWRRCRRGSATRRSFCIRRWLLSLQPGVTEQGRCRRCRWRLRAVGR